MADTQQKPTATTPPPKQGQRSWIAEFYGSALGKKYAMAITGIVLLAYVVVHMIGNLKLYQGPEDINAYAEWLRQIAYPALPEEGGLWIFRVVLGGSVLIHIHAAFALWLDNRRKRPAKYEKRDYVAVNFANRTMRWTGIIIALFIVFHIADLTLGATNPAFDKGDVYSNVVASFSNPLIAGIYIVANLALGFHIFHGAWSLFQTMGWNNRRFNHWRRYLAVALAVVVVVGNVSFPLAVLTGVVS
ncbi:MAG: succinate dehydrogenase cytochrome b subunit [Egibacteraceae bacterium]